jgi:hypothetical protein
MSNHNGIGELVLYNKINGIENPDIKLNDASIAILNKLKGELSAIYKDIFATGGDVGDVVAGFETGRLFKSIPPPIQNMISVGGKGVKTSSFKWNIMAHGVTFKVSLRINYSTRDGNPNLKYVKGDDVVVYYKLIRMVMEFLAQQRGGNGGGKPTEKTVDVYVYLIKHIKEVPKSTDTTIDWIHVNTGITTSCRPSTEINIFRAEEWFKVFIHECIHNFCIDFNSEPDEGYKEKLAQLFKIKSDHLLFEAYTETWAEIIQILFISILRDGRDDNQFNQILNDELKFSVIQLNKVFSACTGNEGTYNDLVNSGGKNGKGNSENDVGDVLDKYSENSNCFAYYVLKTIALYFMDDFLGWCVEHNGATTPLQFNKKGATKHIDGYINFFETRYKNGEFTKYVNVIKDVMKAKPKGFLKDTLRISIYEIAV